MLGLSSVWLETTSSPYLNRFLQPDTIIPDLSNPQSWNRYSYVTNRPVNFNDPTGHKMTTDSDGGSCDADCWENLQTRRKLQKELENLNFDLNLSPDFEFTCADCPQSIPKDYLSFIPFSTSDLCYSLHLGPGVCSAETSRTVVDQSVELLHWLSTSFTWGSFGLGFADTMHWVHAPVVGIVIDGIVQVSGDSGQGYTFMQEVTRTGIFIVEGQISSGAGIATAGVDAIPGAVTGLGDVIIIGGSYVVGSAATSFWLNQFNGYIVNNVPGASNYIPYEPVTLPEEWYERPKQ